MTERNLSVDDDDDDDDEDDDDDDDDDDVISGEERYILFTTGNLVSARDIYCLPFGSEVNASVAGAAEIRFHPGKVLYYGKAELKTSDHR